MNDCSHFEDLLGRFFGDELDREDRERLDAHLETCDDCRQLTSLHGRLMEADLDLETASRAEAATVRWSVLAQLRKATLRRWSPPLQATAAAAVLLVGIGLGAAWPRDHSADLLDQLVPTAGAEAETWRLSSVQVAPTGNGQVELRFEMSRPVVVTRRVGDPLVALAVEEALLGAPDLGAKIRAVDTAGRLATNPAILQTLLDTAQRDGSLAVRLRCLNLLHPYRALAEVEEVLLRLVEEDEAVPVRLLALDLLEDATLVEPAASKDSMGVEL